MKKKLLSVILAATMVAGLLSGCGKKEAPKTNEPDKKNEATQAAKEEVNKDGDAADVTPDANQYGDTGGLTLPLVDKPTTITWMLPSDVQDLSNKDVIKEIERRTGITLDIQAFPKASYQDKLQIVLGSGNLPDIITGSVLSEVNNLGGQGAFAAISDYLDMLPNFRALYSENPENSWVMQSYSDAISDGDLSAWSGVEFVLGRPSDGACQPMTMNMKMNNVDMKAVRAYMEEHPEEFPAMADNKDLLDKAPKWGISGFKLTEAKGKEDGSLGFNGEGILFFETNNEGEVIVNTTRIRGYDSTDPWKLAEAEIEGRRQVRCLEKFLKERVKGFENAVLLSTGPGIGVRSSRQIKGVYTITLEDITSCRKFDDVVAHAGYPADVHNPHGTEEIVKEEDNVKYGSMYSVPYRVLVNDKVDNIITVGRCLSATFEAHGAVRTTPIVGAVAQAGGVAAALAVKNGQNTRDIDVKEMQRILLSEGAYLDI